MLERRHCFVTPIADIYYRANPQKFNDHQSALFWGIHGEYLKQPSMSYWDGERFYKKLGEVFNKGRWEEVYFLMQLLVKYYPLDSINESYMQESNKVLEEENSAYRFVARRILPTMSEVEMKEVEEAASKDDDVSGLLISAIDKLSQGDSKNAIKEAVNAVELFSNRLSPQPHSTDLKKALPKALDRLEKELGQQYNPSLKDTFLRLYDYASSEPGVRHGSKDRPSYAEEAEARFAVVVCSALINYLRTKANEAEIDYLQTPEG
jgi:hypothetical protein